MKRSAPPTRKTRRPLDADSSDVEGTSTARARSWCRPCHTRHSADTSPRPLGPCNGKTIRHRAGLHAGLQPSAKWGPPGVRTRARTAPGGLASGAPRAASTAGLALRRSRHSWWTREGRMDKRQWRAAAAAPAAATAPSKKPSSAAPMGEGGRMGQMIAWAGGCRGVCQVSRGSGGQTERGRDGRILPLSRRRIRGRSPPPPHALTTLTRPVQTRPLPRPPPKSGARVPGRRPLRRRRGGGRGAGTRWPSAEYSFAPLARGRPPGRFV